MTRIYHITQRNRHLFTLVGLVLLVSMVSCKKEITETTSYDPNTLPPLTHEGKNTFGCLVNGEVWVAYAPFTVGGTIALEGNYNTETGSFLLEGTLKNNDLNIFETVRIGTHDVYHVGSYIVPAEDNDNISGFLDYKGNYSCSKYYYRSTILNNIDITYLNLSQRIISGIFEMDLVNPSCPGDTIRIREGRFDWRF